MRITHVWKLTGGMAAVFVAAAFFAPGIAEAKPPKEPHFGKGYSPMITRTKIVPQVWQPVGIDDRMTDSGNHAVIVVRIDFPDVQFRSDHDQAYYQNIYNGSGGVSDFYKDQSENKIGLTYTVSSKVYRMPNPIASYSSECDPSYGSVIGDAVKTADPDINFKSYDALIVEYAGPGDLWAYMCPSGSFQSISTNDGATIFEFVLVPESDPNVGLDASIQATVSHEFGHQLGIPDLYAYGWSGTGEWDIMSGGEDYSTNKAFSFGAWSKMWLGWVMPQVKVGVDEDETLNSVETNPDVFIKVPINGNASSNEYFLIECRQKAAVDQNLPGEGLLIWHIKDDSPYDSNTAVPDDPTTIRTQAPVLVEQADGKEDLENGTNNGDSGDPFPGSSSNSSFTGSTQPNSNTRNGAPSGLEVTRISFSGGQAKFHLRVGAASGGFSVKLTSPANGAFVNGTVNIAASVQGSATTQFVEFDLDGNLLAKDPTAPYSFNWDTASAPEGVHTITATAVDLSGNTATDSVRVTVDRTPPQIQIASPANNSFVSGKVVVTTQATDNFQVARVDFFLDGTLSQTVYSAPYDMQWNTLLSPDGPHAIKAQVFDGAGLNAQAQLALTSDNTPPVIQITNPKDGEFVGGIVTIKHTVSDNVGVVGVELRIDGTLKGTLSPPYTYDWDTSTAVGKNHVIQSTARDQSGNATVATANVTVKNDFTPPIAAFSIPPANAVVCGNVKSVVTASDNVGVQRIDLAVDNVADPSLLSPVTLNGPPYDFMFTATPAATGPHFLKATAVDTSDNSADATLPLFVSYPKHTPPPGYPPTGGLDLTFSVTDSNVSAATLLYRALNSGDLFTGTHSINQSAGVYVFSLSASNLPPSGLEYYMLLEASYYSCETPRYTVVSPYTAGDVNRDGRVDELDAMEIAALFGVARGDSRYLPLADANLDGVIDEKDVAYVFAHFSP